MKRLFSIVVSVILILVMLCSCGDTNSNGQNNNEQNIDGKKPANVKIFYCSSDSYNPYEAITNTNRHLSTLIYDPLVTITPDLQTKYILADKIELDGKKCTVTLKNAYFTDGSPVLANDVIFSLKLAKAENSIYAPYLTEITSYTAEGENKIVIRLSKADPYVASLLTFPIIKSGSDKLKDESNRVIAPIGSGRYIPNFKEEKLIANPNYVLGEFELKEINLLNAPDEKVINYNLENGNISIYFSEISDGVIPTMVGNIEAINLNNIVYLGVNLNDGLLGNIKIRYALSLALNRTEICKDAYYSYATSATGLYPPNWDEASGLQNIQNTPDEKNFVAILQDLGYNSKDNDGYYVNSNGKQLSFNLITYSGNERRLAVAELIKEQLKTAGIKVNIKSQNWNTYLSSLNSGSFDLYLAETKLLNNMDISELVTSNGSLSYGIPNTTIKDETNSKPDTEVQSSSNNELSLDKTIEGFYDGQNTIIDIINAFNNEMPIIPICYRAGVTLYDTNLIVDNVSSVNDVYFGIENITAK